MQGGRAPVERVDECLTGVLVDRQRHFDVGELGGKLTVVFGRVKAQGLDAAQQGEAALRLSLHVPDCSRGSRL